MKIIYQQFKFLLEFEHPTSIQMLPTFFIRSIIGLQLRKVVCLFRDRECGRCQIQHHCAYALVFENPVSPEQSTLPGRNFAPHPFILVNPDIIPRRDNQLTFTLTLIGRAIQFFPYFFYAIKKGGEDGIFYNRMPFRIKSVSCDGLEMLLSEEELAAPPDNHLWMFDAKTQQQWDQQLKIQFVTPLRYKWRGKYQRQISYPELINSIYRRMRMLTDFYGEPNGDSTEFRLEPKKQVKQNATFRWKDYSRYSARQRTSIKLGGIIGELNVKGTLSAQELALLRAGEIFHVGKNVGFGLGQIKIEAIED
ncbi:MAG: CRISPR system precrRNA processing endoribonuclease RAMP protein Cas6 [Calditrichia bacterium]